MANKMSIDISLNAKAYNDGIKDIKKSTEEYNNQVKSVKDNLPSLSKQLAHTRKETKNLALAVANLTEEQRNTAEGRKMIKMLQDTQKEYARLIDINMDAQAAAKRLASDTFGLDVLKDSINGVGSAFSALTGIIGTVTNDEEKMKKAVAGVATTMATVNSITSIANLLQKESALMLGISTLQENLKTKAIELNTAAQGKNIVVTKAATVAQATLNAVADANPYLLIVSAIGLLVGAYISFEDEINHLIGIEDDAEKEQKELADAYKDQAKTLADTKVKVYNLQLEWKNLKSEAEKNQWIKDNKDKFEELGIEVKNVHDAENLLVKNVDVFLKAQEAKAKALAYAAVAATKYQKAIEKREEADQSDIAWYEGAFKQLQQWASGKYVQSFKQMKYSRAAAIYDEAEAAEEQAAQYLEEAAKLNEEASKMLDDAGFKEHKKNDTTKTTSTKTTSKKDDEPKNELEKLEKSKKELEEARKKLIDKDGVITNQELFDNLSDQIKRINDILAKAQNSLSFDVKVDVKEQEIREVQRKIDELLNKDAEKKLKLDTGGLKDEMKDQAEAAYAEYDRLYSAYDGLVKMLNEPNLSTEKYGLVQAAIDSISESYQRATDEVKKYNEASALNKEHVEDQKQMNEQLNLSAQALDNAINAFGNIGKIVESEELQVMGIIAQAIANIALSFSSAMKAEAGKGIWNWIAAGAAGLLQMTNMISAIKAQTKGYAGGGVIEGPLQYGDRMLARVNAGEMILNKRQQTHLFDMIDEGKFNGSATRIYGSVTVRGDDLDIALTNHNNINKRAR